MASPSGNGESAQAFMKDALRVVLFPWDTDDDKTYYFYYMYANRIGSPEFSWILAVQANNKHQPI